MIVRIMGEGQYKVPSSLLDELNAIDNRIVEHIAKESESDYRMELGNIIAAIKKNGTPIDASEIMESDIIVPPEDLTLEEAREVFSGTGIIED